MKVRDLMTRDPVCCLPSDTVQAVACRMRDEDVGALPVIDNRKSRRLLGIITDRDLCCRSTAAGHDPKTTKVESHISRKPTVCHAEDNVSQCEKVMRQSRVRRVPVVDNAGRCIGIIAQADLALKDKPQNVARVLADISEPAPRRKAAAA